MIGYTISKLRTCSNVVPAKPQNATTVCVEKMMPLVLTLADVGWPIFNFFTIRFRKEFAIKPLSHFVPHFTYVATLPCEM